MHVVGDSHAENPKWNSCYQHYNTGMENYTLSVVDLRRKAGLLNVVEAADLLGLPLRRFRYLLESSRVFRPQTRIGRKARPYYTTTEVEGIRERLKALASCHET
jgi:hypothetical protein